MKLSQMTTDQVADVLLTIIPEIELLMSDDELSNMWKNRTTTKDKEEAKKLGLVTVFKIASYLMREHRESTWRILGAVNNKTPEDIGRQMFTTTVKQISEILQDKELMSFFTSPAKSDTTTVSDTSQESTESQPVRLLSS